MERIEVKKTPKKKPTDRVFWSLWVDQRFIRDYKTKSEALELGERVIRHVDEQERQAEEDLRLEFGDY